MLLCARRQLADVVVRCVTLLWCRVAVHHGEVQQRDGVRGSARAAALCGQRFSQPPHLLVSRQSAHPARRPPLHGNSPAADTPATPLRAFTGGMVLLFHSFKLPYSDKAQEQNKTNKQNANDNCYSSTL